MKAHVLPSSSGWREIPGFSRYLANDRAQIWSKFHGRVMSPRDRGNGYAQLALIDDQGRKIAMGINRIICLAFHGNPPTPKHEAAHWDGRPSNNTPINLRWATHRENGEDQKRHGTWQSGSNHPGARLVEEQVREIRAIHSASKGRSGCARPGTIPALGKQFGVNISTIKDILIRRSRREVEP